MGRRRVRFAEVAPGDVERLAAGLREADALELALYTGLPRLEAVRLAVGVSDLVLCGWVDDELVAMWGVRQESLMEDSAVIWALTTGAAERYWVTFLRWSRMGLEMLQEAVPAEMYTNYALKGNKLHVGWLEWLGAWWSVGDVIWIKGYEFRRFGLERHGGGGVAEYRR